MPEIIDTTENEMGTHEANDDPEKISQEQSQIMPQSFALKFSQVVLALRSCWGEFCKILTPSHGAKMLLGSVMAALAIGCLLAFGVLTCFKAFDSQNSGSTTRRRVNNVAPQKIVLIMSQGKSAYKLREYADSAKFYEQAHDEKPDEAQKSVIEENLTACYIQMAQSEKTALNLTLAKEWYDKALKIGANPLTAQAQSERAEVLELMVRIAGGFKHETQNTSNAPTNTSISVSQEVANAPFRRAAQKLIDEGDALYRSGDTENARKKWIEAAGEAPGNTPEYVAAKKRLDETNVAPAPDNQPGL